MLLSKMFCSGLRYVIDKMLLNCTVAQLTDTDYGAQIVRTSTGHDITMKNPLDAFRIFDTYRFVGQVHTELKRKHKY